MGFLQGMFRDMTTPKGLPLGHQSMVRVDSQVVKRSFVPLREFRDLTDANAQLRAWLLGPAGVDLSPTHAAAHRPRAGGNPWRE